ncbi:MAG TPA: hypothetical protein VFA07_09685 [Chthonomonadaceae bacterium]|nr:hypothetical protein [Chthonomonadaceae bacterium]
MTIASRQQEQAALCVAESTRLHAEGALQEALASIRRAVLLYAAADTTAALEEGDPAAIPMWRVRAAACRLCGDYLVEAGQYPEAARVYQEAIDLYQQIGDPEADQEARTCAHQVVEIVDALRDHPQERLYLLIAHYERQQQQIALEPGTERLQAEYSVQIARVFERRERFSEALDRYREALDLYARAEPIPETLLGCAECHHRMAAILSYSGRDLPAAAEHYREAISLYALHEPRVFGVQASHAFCVRALNETLRRLEEDGRSTQTSRE